MTWTKRFTSYMKKRGLSQLDVAFELHVSPSKIHYWAHGAVPRIDTREKIARWSKGEVPADVEPGVAKAS